MKPLFTKKNGTSQRVAAIEVKMPASYPASRLSYESVSVTADGVKTYNQLFVDLYNLVDLSKVTIRMILQVNVMLFYTYSITSSFINFTQNYPNANGATAERITLSDNSSYAKWERSRGASFTNIGTEVPASGTTITLYY